MISTSPHLSLPAREGEAELLNSSLSSLAVAAGPAWTVCARLLTHQFSTYPDTLPLQAVITAGHRTILSSYLAQPCDQIFPGCSKHYQGFVGTGWKQGKVYGYYQQVGWHGKGRGDCDYQLFMLSCLMFSGTTKIRSIPRLGSRGLDQCLHH